MFEQYIINLQYKGQDMGFADLHIHTIYSWDGICDVSAILKYTADKTFLNVIAITDHDEIAGAFKAQELAPKYGIEVIPGCEISTAEGHLLALFIQRPIPPSLSLEETVRRVGKQGGLCIAAHPMARGASSLSAEAIISALKTPENASVLIGIETFNAGIFHRQGNEAAQTLADSMPIAQVGNSDAHILTAVGQGATQFPGKTAEDLRQALMDKTTHPILSMGNSHLDYVRKWLPGYLLRSAGWVAWNSHPQKPIQISHIKHISQAQQAAQ
jgi:hypothetical protein